MAVYKVECLHHRKAIVRGDLEAETVIESSCVFKSKKEVVAYLQQKESQAKLRGYKTKSSYFVRGKMPSLAVYTNVKWIHENSGEEEKEYYWYKTEKV